MHRFKARFELTVKNNDTFIQMDIYMDDLLLADVNAIMPDET